MPVPDDSPSASELLQRLHELALAAGQNGDYDTASRLYALSAPISRWVQAGEPPPAIPEIALAHNETATPEPAAEVNFSTGARSAQFEPASPNEWIPTGADLGDEPGDFDGPVDVRRFPDISPEAFQHEWDIQALRALQTVPLLDRMITWVSENYYERQMRLTLISQCVRIGKKQAPKIYEKYEEAAEILDMKVIPEIFVSTGAQVNAYTAGMKDHHIVLTSGLLEIMNEAELLAVIGHELGHIKCMHMRYNTMASVLGNFSAAMMGELSIPFVGKLGSLAANGIALSLLDWQRKAEFSCDRAALLVVQEPMVVARMLTKLAGGSQKVLPQLNIKAILEQAEEYDSEETGTFGRLLKLNMLLTRTHPYPIRRVREIMQWSQSTQYEKILKGDYIKIPRLTAPSMLGPTKRKCPQCGQFSRRAAKFCSRDRVALRDIPLQCSRCDSLVPNGAEECAICHSRLVE